MLKSGVGMAWEIEGVTWPGVGKGWKNRYEVIGVKDKDYMMLFLCGL